MNIGLRLSDHERETLKLLVAALKVSEYTDNVDDFRSSYAREGRIEKCMVELFHTIIGLSIAAGQLPKTILDKMRDDTIKAADFQDVLENTFEVGRRYKRLNPHKLQEYGKLAMLLQDASKSRLQQLGYSRIMHPIQTVGSVLRQLGALELLKDPNMALATRQLPADADKAASLEKGEALAALIAKYGGDETDRRKMVERCVRSVDDAESFKCTCRAPVQYLMSSLETLFKREGEGTSIAISRGPGGSMLSHSHDTHYLYVMESLTLWDIIQRDMFDFWEVVEEDLILDCGGHYRIMDTGQGYHRVCAAPKTHSRMSSSISEAHNKMGGWIGIKVVHLGDQDVPNALVFIDKYTNIPNMLQPIVHTLSALSDIFDTKKAESHIGVRNLLCAKYKNFENLRRMILRDFFRYAFDGSGDDGGSCIDGRLTSAWNWCSLLHKKGYYDAFVLTGFSGFN